MTMIHAVGEESSVGIPLQPSRAVVGHQKWMAQHNRMVGATLTASSTKGDLDFVMIGDSITQRFMGTKLISAIPAPEYKQVFDEYFDKSQGGGALQGLALGSSGDVCTELLWHLENGMLPDSLNPKVWIILIGTNDLGLSNCSKRNTLAGILNVAHFLREHKPNTPIILHGLLPRADAFNTGDYTLGDGNTLEANHVD
jgi:lysophospholipase L1-like esterase